MRQTALAFLAATVFAFTPTIHAQDDAPPQAVYDFHPAANVIFADDFASAPVGEFPPKWKISSGQAVIAKIGGRSAFSFIGTDSGHVEPRIKQSNYLPSAFTVEFDLYLKPTAIRSSSTSPKTRTTPASFPSPPRMSGLPRRKTPAPTRPTPNLGRGRISATAGIM